MQEIKRETFAGVFGAIATMIGVAVGLGAVWRFPYMMARYGGISFLLTYTLIVAFIGVPALMAEWKLGQLTQTGTWGAFKKSGLWGGKLMGPFLFWVVLFASGYYSNAVGWVGYHAWAEVWNGLGGTIEPMKILPPPVGINATALLLQLTMTAVVLAGAALVLLKGIRQGIEKSSKIIIPGLFAILLILCIRSLVLPGAIDGLKQFIGHLSGSAFSPSTIAAAMGMAFFSLSLGGTFMVVYGSYLKKGSPVTGNAVWTGSGALLAGLFSGLAIFPSIYTLKLTISSGPELIFLVVPKIFARMPMGWLFLLLFYLALFAAAFLSAIAALEVLICGLTDRFGWQRKRAIYAVVLAVYLLAIPPMINMKIFIPWDLMFGSGMQVLGSFMAVLASMKLYRAHHARGKQAEAKGTTLYRIWLGYVVPAAILFIGMQWFLDAILNIQLFE